LNNNTETPNLLELNIKTMDEYNLENKKIIQRQIDILYDYKISGIAMYYYWFSRNSITNQNMIMDKVVNNFFDSSINLKNLNVFFIWANEDWSNNKAFGDSNEKIEQQLKFVQQQQQISIEVLSQLIQAIQSPNAVDLSNLQNRLATYLSGETTIPVNPVIEYLNEHRIELEQKYHNPSIVSDGDDVGKLRNIAEALTHIQSFKLTQYRLGKKVLPEHIVIERGNQYHVIAFLEISGTPFTSRISNFNQLVINNPQSKFDLIASFKDHS
jgi:hypothetical protein